MRKYKFDLNDIIAIIQVVNVIGIIAGYRMELFFIIASSLGLYIGFKMKRVNICLINLAFIVLNIYYLFA